jgi:hypothetical protein
MGVPSDLASNSEFGPETLLDVDDRCFHYRGFLLMCDPARLVGGGYQAHAVVTRADQTGDTMFASTPDNVAFISEEAAVTHAKDWAALWVDENVGA